jgi:hypothetical protein
VIFAAHANPDDDALDGRSSGPRLDRHSPEGQLAQNVPANLSDADQRTPVIKVADVLPADI